MKRWTGTKTEGRMGMEKMESRGENAYLRHIGPVIF